MSIARSSLRIVFFGTPDFATASLHQMLENNHNVVGVVTAPDKPAGRGKKLLASDVKRFAQSADIHLMQPSNLKSPAFISELKALNADLQIVVAFRMLPEMVWNMPRLGTYNVHASLLPNYRGAAPINWAIINGEAETGVSTFKLQHEIDTGGILLQAKMPITDQDNAGTLYQKLKNKGADLLIESIKLIEKGDPDLTAQSGLNHKKAPKIHKTDCSINWMQPAKKVRDFIRGMAPFPGAFAEVMVNGELTRWKIFSASLTNIVVESAGEVQIDGNKLLISATDFWLEIAEIQTSGKKRMASADFLRGLGNGAVKIKIL